MLQRAILYSDQIYRANIKASDDPRNKYYSSGFWTWNPKLEDNNEHCQAFVSVDEYQNVLGFMQAILSKSAHYVNGLSVISYEYPPSWTFHKDFRDFIIKLFVDYKYAKIIYGVYVGSAHEKLYDKFTHKFGGRIVGVFYKDVMLEDETLADQKYYELHRDEFYKHATKYIERYEKCRKKQL